MANLDPTPACLESIPPRPQDEAATRDCLQECSSTISKQLLLIVIRESAKTVDFEGEVPNEHMKPRSSGNSGIIVGAAENGWHLSYLLRNGDLEESIKNYSWKYKNSEAKRLLAKWNELYASESAKELNRRNKEFNFIILSGNNF